MHHRSVSENSELYFAGSGRWSALFLLSLAFLFASSHDVFTQASQTSRIFEGRAQIVDGDTLEIGIHRIDLFGIDAPESDQNCERGGRQWRCGMEATYAMAALIETHWVTCRQQGHDTESGAAANPLAVCRMGGPKGLSINQEIVRRGWALALTSSENDYVGAQQQAQAAKVGLWSGTFVTPWEWRRTHEPGKTVN